MNAPVPDSDIPIHIVSFGGVASKMLVKWLYPDQTPAYCERAHHHWRSRPVDVGAHQRFAYVFGDPRNSVVSFFQRKISRHGGHGFEWSERHLLPYPKWTTLAVGHLEAKPVGLTEEWELADIVERDVDPFQFEDHFKRWLSYGEDLPVTFVRYETMWDNAPLLARIFDREVTSFPQRASRRANWQSESAEIGAGLTHLYGRFAEYLTTFPDVFTIRDGRPVGSPEQP
jgi:hypothetical protein